MNRGVVQPRAKTLRPLREYGAGPIIQLAYVWGLVGLMYMLAGLGKKAVIVC